MSADTKLTVVFKGQRSSDDSMHYQIYDCVSWQVIGELLVLQQSDKSRYLPLVNIESFFEEGE